MRQAAVTPFGSCCYLPKYSLARAGSMMITAILPLGIARISRWNPTRAIIFSLLRLSKALALMMVCGLFR